MFSVVITTFSVLLFLFVLCESETTTGQDVLLRGKRQLLFPNSTLLQFNAGIGTPSPAKMINVNWAFQANFQLPWNRSQIPVDIFEANSGYTEFSRKKREIDLDKGDYENDAKLFHFYKYVEQVLDGFGYNGSSCILQTLCRLGAEPLHTDDEEDLLHELASYVLNPTNDVDHGVTESHEGYRYIEAYKEGENGQDCFKSYSHCSMSLIDMFTIMHGHETK